VPEQYDFAVAWFTERSTIRNSIVALTNITNWIVNNAEALNIQYAVTTGTS
jgi:hypothetical protein